MIIKIITMIFISFALSRAVLRFRDKSIKITEFALWIIVWSTVLILVFVPNISDKIASGLGIQRGTDTVFFIAIMVIFYLIFRVYIKTDKLDKDITRLTVNISKTIHKSKTKDNK
jgi:hypothetical protein